MILFQLIFIYNFYYKRGISLSYQLISIYSGEKLFLYAYPNISIIEGTNCSWDSAVDFEAR